MGSPIVVSGNVRLKVERGTWPFRREATEISSFKCTLSTARPKEQVSEMLTLWIEDKEGSYVLMGKIKSVVCMFGQIDKEEPRGFQFQMTSVTGIVVSGSVTPALA